MSGDALKENQTCLHVTVTGPCFPRVLLTQVPNIKKGIHETSDRWRVLNKATVTDVFAYPAVVLQCFPHSICALKNKLVNPSGSVSVVIFSVSAQVLLTQENIKVRDRGRKRKVIYK